MERLIDKVLSGTAGGGKEEDFYVVLGCPDTASHEQIRAEYYVRALQIHPDHVVRRKGVGGGGGGGGGEGDISTQMQPALVEHSAFLAENSRCSSVSSPITVAVTTSDTSDTCTKQRCCHHDASKAASKKTCTAAGNDDISTPAITSENKSTITATATAATTTSEASAASSSTAFQRLQAAYAVLSDPKERAMYDRWRGSGLHISYTKWKTMGAHALHFASRAHPSKSGRALEEKAALTVAAARSGIIGDGNVVTTGSKRRVKTLNSESDITNPVIEVKRPRKASAVRNCVAFSTSASLVNFRAGADAGRQKHVGHTASPLEATTAHALRQFRSGAI